jgi:hypothetical protein
MPVLERAPIKHWLHGSTSKARAIVRTILASADGTPLDSHAIYSECLAKFPVESENTPAQPDARKPDKTPFNKALVSHLMMRTHPIRSMRSVS